MCTLFPRCLISWPQHTLLCFAFAYLRFCSHNLRAHQTQIDSCITRMPLIIPIISGMLKSSCVFEHYGYTYSHADKSKHALDGSCHVCWDCFCFLPWTCMCPSPKPHIRCLLPFDLFLTLTCSRCRLTTASESRLRRCRWVIWRQWPAWCSHSL